MPDLSDRLKALGVKIGAQDLPRPAPRRSTNLDDVLHGRLLQNASGEAYLVEEIYPADYAHGRIGIGILSSAGLLHEWGRASHLDGCSPSGYYFLDTETTGLSGGTGTYPFLVGIGHFTERGFELQQYLMRDPTDEPALLSALTEALSPCQALVTYNGKAFDAPLLNTRYILQGLSSPVIPLPNLDLLPLARRIWRARLPSRSLSYLETAVMGAYRSQEEVPGWLIPQIYFDYLRSGDARPLGGVLYHNAMDILALAALFSYCIELLARPLELDGIDPLDLVSIAALLEDLGYTDTAVQVFRSGLEKGLPEEYFWNTIDRLARLHRRKGDWQQAALFWQKAAAAGRWEAMVELAKYYEHVARSAADALSWTKSALELAAGPAFPPYLRRQVTADLEHRRSRLLRILSNSR